MDEKLSDVEGTFIERLMSREDVLEAMLSIPEQQNAQFAESRREELFDVFWQETSYGKEQVLGYVQDREDDFIEEFGHLSVPDWMLRCEAQDLLQQTIVEKLE